MPKNWVLPAAGLVAIVVVILIVVFATRGGYRAPSTQQPTVQSPAPPAVLSNSISVSDQAAGQAMTIEAVNLKESGYVVIHEDAKGSPGKVIGNSTALQAGTYNNLSINLTRAAKEGEVLYAMLHSDDGDGTYGFPDEDFPIKDDQGKVVLQKFTVTGTQAGAVKLAVSGNEYSFSPKNLTVKAGQKVELTFTNTGATGHTFTVDEINLDTGIVAAGGSKTVTFTAPATGVLSYTSYCTVTGHRGLGMVGALKIE